jgi:hypothetical protein
MRHVRVAVAVVDFIALCLGTLLLLLSHAHAAAAAKAEFVSRGDVMEWIDKYRARPEPERLPDAVKVLSQSLVLREPETAGFYVGFVAGVLGANPQEAEHLVIRMTPLPPSDQWLVVRAIAYSGLPAWKSLLARVTDKLPARRGMIDAYLMDKLPTLDRIELDKSPTFMEKVGMHLGMAPKTPEISYGRNPELLDTLWGEYFAAGHYGPIWRIITMLPWSKDRDSGERLAVGSSAKLTLANNAARYPDVLALIKRTAPYQDKETKAVLAEVIHAAETTETGNIRKEQLALMDKLKTKGSGSQTDMKLWGYLGQGAIGVTCVTLAALSYSVAGIPCVIGGAATSAVLNYWAAK